MMDTSNEVQTAANEEVQSVPKSLNVNQLLRVKIIQTRKLWFELCRKAGVESADTDELSVILVNGESKLKELGVASGDLVDLAAEPDPSLSNPRWRLARCYGIDINRETVLMSPILWFNLTLYQSFRSACSGRQNAMVQRPAQSDSARSSVPLTPWANNITIKLISSFHYPATLKLTQALTRYFSTRRHLCLNDVIAVSRDCLDGDDYTVNLSAEAPVAFYKVTKLLGPWREGFLADDMTFLADNLHSDLTQGAGCLVHRIPIEMQWFFSLQPPGEYWRRHPLPGLGSIHIRLLQAIKPYLQPSFPRLLATILLMGPPGCGKFSVVNSLAVQLGIQVIKVNCHDLCGDSAAATEARIRNLFSKAQSCTPSILLLENFEALGREKDPASYDIRIAASFGETIRKCGEKGELPLIIIATTSSTRVNTDMSEIFLHEFNILAPTEEERAEMLGALLSMNDPHTDSADINVASLAKRTAGMVLADMVALVTTARVRAHRRIVRENYGESVCPNWWEEKGLCQSEGAVVLTGKDLDDALMELQSEHADAMGAPKIPNVSWDDVGGLDEVKAEILDTIQLPLTHPHLFAQDLRRSGVLLYGPPGSGKTLLAKAVATECSLNFLSVKGPELINMYVGQSEENIREVFSRARSAAPCVVFFDELDSLAPNRGRTGDSGGVMDRVVSQLLAELDGLHSRADVFIIGATNRPDLLDPALTRPGRFDKLLYVGVPDSRPLQINILKALTRKFKLCESVDLSEVANRCPLTLTGADLYALCADAMMSSIRRQVVAKEKGAECVKLVTMSDFMSALKSLKPSVSEDEMVRYKHLQMKQKQR